MSEHAVDWIVGALLLVATTGFAALIPAMMWFDMLPW